MDSLYKMGAKALASRLKRVSDGLMAEVDIVYQELNLPFDPPCYPLFALVLQNEGHDISLSDAANALGISHAAVSQKAAKLVKRGYVELQLVEGDKRSKTLHITPKGEEVATHLAPFWQAIDYAIGPMMSEQGPFMHQIAKLEAYISSGQFRTDIIHRYRPIQIFSWRPEWSHYFYQLNRDWVEQFFVMEPIDEAVLSDPEQHILRDGGQVFFAQYKGEILGTGALMRTGDAEFEFTKMALSSEHRGLGIGKMLIKHALDYAYRNLNAEEVWLLTSGKLEAANTLYAQVGFIEEELSAKDRAKYQRADRKWRYVFEKQGVPKVA